MKIIPYREKRMWGMGIGLLGMMAAGSLGGQDLTGTWHLREFIYEVSPWMDGDAWSSTDTLTVESLGGGSYRVSSSGGTEEITFEQNGNLFRMVASGPGEQVDDTTHDVVQLEWIREDLVVLTSVYANYYTPMNRLTWFEGSAGVLTREPLPQPDPAKWAGSYDLSERGMVAMGHVQQIDFEQDSGSVGILRSTANTYLAGIVGDISESFWTFEDLLLSTEEDRSGRITYADADWRVRLVAEDDQVGLLQIDADTIFAANFYSMRGMLEAIDPEKHGFPAPELILSNGEVYTALLTRNAEPLPEISPLATSPTGVFLSYYSERLSPNHDWYFIEWFGYFMLYGANYGNHIDYGPFYFGASGEDVPSSGAWIYLSDRGQWYLFAPVYGLGKAYDPVADEVVTF